MAEFRCAICGLFHPSKHSLAMHMLRDHNNGRGSKMVHSKKCSKCRKNAGYQIRPMGMSVRVKFCSDHLEEGIDQVAGNNDTVVVELIG